MDFIKRLEQLFEYLADMRERDGEKEYDAVTLVSLIDKTLLDGLVFRSRGLELLSKEQFDILRDLLNGLTSMTDDRMRKVHKDMPELYILLRFLNDIDNESYISLMYLLKP